MESKKVSAPGNGCVDSGDSLCNWPSLWNILEAFIIFRPNLAGNEYTNNVTITTNIRSPEC